MLLTRRKVSDHSSHRVDSLARFNSQKDKEPGKHVSVIVPRRRWYGAVNSLDNEDLLQKACSVAMKFTRINRREYLFFHTEEKRKKREIYF